jgi:mRNA-degrading endonuclease RelE of RelBE toxin-antitoxin system
MEGRAREPVFSPDASRQFRKLRASARARLAEAIRLRLENEDATLEDRNRFRLRRPSPWASYELRVEAWRVFYRVRNGRVEVLLIGKKRGEKLIIDGKEFVL